MKVAQVCPRYFPYIGGIETHVKEISERLVKKGFEVSVFTTDPSGELPKEEFISGVEVRRFKSWAPGEVYYFSKELMRHFAENLNNYDVVHAHNYHAFPALAATMTKRKAKLVLTPHYFGIDSSRATAFAHIPYLLIGGWMLRSADKIVCVSEEEREVLIRRFLIKSQKVTYIPNGVNYCEIADSKPLLKDSMFRILYVGRLSKEKDLKTLIRACKKVEHDIPNMQLVIIGEGPEKGNLRKIALKASLKNVFWVGEVPHKEVGGYFKSASVFVLPSHRECSPISVLEALAAGVPVIVSSSINRKMMKEKGVGLVFKKGDESDLARKILKIYREGDVREFLSSRGKSYVKHFDWNEIVERLIRLYHSMF